LNELALEAYSPLLIVATRIVFGMLVLFTYLRFSGASLPRAPREWLPMAVIAVFGVIVPFFLTVWAQTHLSSAITAVLMAVMPLMVMSLAHVFVPGERLSIAKVLGFGTGFIGVVLVVGPDSPGDDSRFSLIASFAVLTAALSYSGTSVYARLRSNQAPAAMATGMLIVAAAIAVPAALVEGQALPVQLSPVALTAVALLGLFATGLASVLYFQVVSGPGPTFLSIVNYLVPGWGVVLGVIVLDEQLSSSAFAGLGIILAGIALSEFGHRWLARRSTVAAAAPADCQSL
jgi:drug/metabolite transporter (DMT)-like permease